LILQLAQVIVDYMPEKAAPVVSQIEIALAFSMIVTWAFDHAFVSFPYMFASIGNSYTT